MEIATEYHISQYTLAKTLSLSLQRSGNIAKDSCIFIIRVGDELNLISGASVKSQQSAIDMTAIRFDGPLAELNYMDGNIVIAWLGFLFEIVRGIRFNNSPGFVWGVQLGLLWWCNQ